ncbi:MAG: hypothetical protein E6923_13975 [Clostridium sp.]|uniref:hypothetical protein n=1 Tax=Clostridium sp. TaxID=1506 RepID=UPI0029042197|nr:hypothetical protein [Clostridium sp.]MDU1311517.1 hypothetical protein [Clostridium sp.]MDU1408965.1 hypothetical protein [Clostridium sp.]
MIEGWSRIYRSIQEHWLWTCEPFSRGQAWIDLLLMVNHKSAKVMVNGNLIIVERGQRITSIRKLSDRWKWSTKKVTHFLEQLVKDNMIEYITDNSKTVITIINYDKYQGKETPLAIENTGIDKDVGNTEETQKKHERNTEETEKKHGGNAEEKQKKTNKNDKEYIKNDKEGKEREEVPSLLPLSYPTPIHKLAFDNFGEVSYRMWFDGADIKEDGELIIITVEEFKKKIVQDRYGPQIALLTGKKVSVNEL